MNPIPTEYAGNLKPDTKVVLASYAEKLEEICQYESAKLIIVSKILDEAHEALNKYRNKTT